MRDLVSIVIPTYNRAPYLRDAVDSVSAQTIRNFEIIVVDDGSADHTHELVLSYKDKVKYLYQDHEERAAARNKGIRCAKGAYIAFLDSDDLWLSNHLEECLKALQSNPDAGLCYSGSYMIDQNGEIISKV
ncbi:MAG TPA: glycosyltransferase family A protein [Nitrososphaera sp.]|nr:glycosyltransferase family A protein [Nitrososphaera sp.]